GQARWNSGAAARGGPDPDRRAARLFDLDLRRRTTSRSEDDPPGSWDVDQPARPGAALYQVDRGAFDRERVWDSVSGLLRHFRQHPEGLEYCERPQSHRIRPAGRLRGRLRRPDPRAAAEGG